MRTLLLLMLALPLMPHLTAQAETLRRSYKKPAPETLPLSKSFFREEEVRGTCSQMRCEDRKERNYKEVCKDETNYKYVCAPKQDCKFLNGRYTCETKQVCEYKFVTERKCERKWVDEVKRYCFHEEYSCMKKVKVLDRKWEVVLKPSFDPRATPKKSKDEKIEISLEGDERDPKLKVKVQRSPYKYTTDYKFANPPTEAQIDFRLQE